MYYYIHMYYIDQIGRIMVLCTRDPDESPCEAQEPRLCIDGLPFNAVSSAPWRDNWDKPWKMAQVFLATPDL